MVNSISLVKNIIEVILILERVRKAIKENQSIKGRYYPVLLT